ncbi:pyridoxamine 5'-phosphate oxidase [Amphiplicatus metriothermophilus]|uniref:Pyridoxine/pyridoxamine 5'-phosphate oxidase n=1 Tax=Amphiplicatus metriothermophilus TaxID=1519374 RepID=A0A239PIA4_9PROT|nr:pyridoxamine 5'-phosphate oxidase [Amphiplicatus metriothermophilus]MBB5518124.1 pyridoxamine 5'-phosphate oxidase [Amphiplicatus metriothermophilus]SNT67542.1 Pyridoxamine 5'-phosphate oxidase [Amphiplicatus metriothermophilus]
MPRSPIIPPSPSEEAYAVDEDQGEVFTSEDPIALFAEWLALAAKKEPNDPNAMALATADADGLPDVRMVLLKDFGAEGLTFYTNIESAKGRQLAANPKAAVCFHWKTIRRQVRARGTVTPVSTEEADAYFATRARGAKIAAWASAQSRVLEGRFALEKAVAAKAAEFGLKEIPRPPYWSGYRMIPSQIEFWANRPFRLHDRLLFTRAGAGWKTTRLYP